LNRVVYFSGTGNSLKIARETARHIGGGELVSMAHDDKNMPNRHYDTTGFVFPVYFWGLPHIVRRFVTAMSGHHSSYYYAITTSGGSPGNGLPQLKALLKHCHDIELNYGQNITMQTNYILHNYLMYFHNFHNLEKNAQVILEKAEKKLRLVTDHINRRENNKIGNINKFREIYYNRYMRHISRIDRHYRVSDDCIRCGICVTICPVKNIALINDKPEFKSHCEQCLACMHYCPRRAINYKNITQNRKRYTNPQ
jgi:ferredoxin/flavodoxin